MTDHPDCQNCGHPHSHHTEWWDASDSGGGDGMGCASCQCADYARPKEPTVASERIAAPRGYTTCNVLRGRVQTSHLVVLDENGRNGGRPTVCGLTRFDQRDPDTYAIVRKADLPGWGMGGSGCYGPDIEQRPCPECFAAAPPKEGADRGE